MSKMSQMLSKSIPDSSKRAEEQSTKMNNRVNESLKGDQPMASIVDLSNKKEVNRKTIESKKGDESIGVREDSDLSSTDSNLYFLSLEEMQDDKKSGPNTSR